MNIVDVTAVVGHQTGLHLSVEGRSEDFWICLGELVGWGRFSLYSNREEMAVPWVWELVEILPPDAPEPENVVTFNRVLFTVKEAIELHEKYQARRSEETYRPSSRRASTPPRFNQTS
jgi:hypothetical protein